MPTAHRHAPAPTKPGPIVYTDQQLLSRLRSLALGEPTLGRRTYDRRRDPDDPSRALYEARFGSWGKALKRAGLSAITQPAHLHGATTRWTIPQLIAAVRRCRDETGSTTVAAYEAWRTGSATSETTKPAMPPAATIRFRLGSWSRATRIAHEDEGQTP